MKTKFHEFLYEIGILNYREEISSKVIITYYYGSVPVHKLDYVRQVARDFLRLLLLNHLRQKWHWERVRGVIEYLVDVEHC